MFSVLKSQIWSLLIWDWHHSLSNKTSEQKNPNCHNMPKQPGFIQHRKLGLTSCSPRVLNTEARSGHQSGGLSVDRQAERSDDTSESSKFLELRSWLHRFEPSEPQPGLDLFSCCNLLSSDCRSFLPSRSRQLPVGELRINYILSCHHLLLQQT